jgi:hypothetical protein
MYHLAGGQPKPPQLAPSQPKAAQAAKASLAVRPYPISNVALSADERNYYFARGIRFQTGVDPSQAFSQAPPASADSAPCPPLTEPKGSACVPV